MADDEDDDDDALLPIPFDDDFVFTPAPTHHQIITQLWHTMQ